MTGGACGVVVAGVRVGTTEWERPARLKLAPDRAGRLMRPEAPVPTVGQVVAVVDAQLGSGLLRCLGPGCGGRLARWGFGVERDLVGLGGGIGRVRPRRGLGGVGGGGAGAAVEPGRGAAGGAVYDGAGVAAQVRPAGGPGARVAVRAAAAAGGGTRVGGPGR